MVKFGNYTADIIVTLQDGEIADLVGIDNDDNQLAIACDAINWDHIEDELKRLACQMVAKQAKEVRGIVAEVIATDEEDMWG